MKLSVKRAKLTPLCSKTAAGVSAQLLKSKGIHLIFLKKLLNTEISIAAGVLLIYIHIFTAQMKQQIGFTGVAVQNQSMHVAARSTP